MSSSGDFPASPSVSPGSALARRMTVTSGRKWLASYKQSGPLGCLVRMLLGSSRWSSTVVFLTWKASATPARRSLFRLVPLTPSIGETECGLWPTPSAGLFNETEDLGNWLERRERVKATAKNGNGFGTPLGVAVRLWPTPGTRDHHAQGATHNPKAHSSSLATVIQKKGGALYQTPTSLSGHNRGQLNEWGGSGARKKMTQMVSPEELNGSLNPQWVEALMGYPCGWTDLLDGG